MSSGRKPASVHTAERNRDAPAALPPDAEADLAEPDPDFAIVTPEK